MRTRGGFVEYEDVMELFSILGLVGATSMGAEGARLGPTSYGRLHRV